MTITPDMIPDEAIEAAARLSHEMVEDSIAGYETGMPRIPWEKLPADERADDVRDMGLILVAALNAWMDDVKSSKTARIALVLRLRRK